MADANCSGVIFSENSWSMLLSSALHRGCHCGRTPADPWAPAHRPCWWPESADGSHARLAGYSSALRKAGIELDETLVTHSAFSYDAARQAAGHLLDRPDRPTAIFAASDDIALGVIEDARRRSIRTPQDLSVVGFDDTFIASRSAPPLTTVAQLLLEMGRVATRSLAQMISNDVVGTRHIDWRPVLLYAIPAHHHLVAE
jgi:DNA-binding LacI/PurR family transcriptional regulator